MPGINGIQATRQIVNTNPHIGVIVVTMYKDDDSVFAAMRAGARGFGNLASQLIAWMPYIGIIGTQSQKN